MQKTSNGNTCIWLARNFHRARFIMNHNSFSNERNNSPLTILKLFELKRSPPPDSISDTIVNEFCRSDSDKNQLVFLHDFDSSMQNKIPREIHSRNSILWACGVDQTVITKVIIRQKLIEIQNKKWRIIVWFVYVWSRGIEKGAPSALNMRMK